MHLRRSFRRIVWRAGNLALPAFRPHGSRMGSSRASRAVVVSFFMSNMPAEVVAAQRSVLERFVPPDIEIAQVRTRLIHSRSIERFLRKTPHRTVVFLDIDCVPTRAGAIEDLVTRAEHGALAGAVQRSSHLQNGEHLYVAPSCLAITKETFAALGYPSAKRSRRGDVAEEFTHAAEERGIPIELLWPISCEAERWPLTGGRRFGPGTTFEGGFFHLFEIRLPEHHARFIARCREILAAADAGLTPNPRR